MMPFAGSQRVTPGRMVAVDSLRAGLIAAAETFRLVATARGRHSRAGGNP